MKKKINTSDMSPDELLQKADMTINELLDTGGMMEPEIANRFRKRVMDEPTMLQEVRQFSMSRNEVRLPHIASTGRILRAARNQYSSDDDTIGQDEGFGTPNRALSKAERYTVETGLVTVRSKEVIAQINLTYEMLEDVIQGGSIDSTQFENIILDLMAEQSALDLEEKLILGDTASGDDFLALEDGLIKLSTQNAVNHGGNAVNLTLFGNMLNGLPTKYQRNIAKMKFYVHPTVERNYRMQVAARQTGLGDAMTTGNAPVTVLGVPLVAAAAMPNDKAILTDPRNILMGVQRDFMLETVRDPENRLIKLILTMRTGQNVEEADLMVKATNIATN